ncbi:protein NRT1/ PTR FAMILY 1.2-like [Amaranthus tricolor]|uniref:protein NRT1/ PTR FAMILY 1.2-like n=1 Tax=Amaranthus tricolor TaxID=29722 RepID=UPI00258CDC2B|nr:protein NRT1/ PTR FAMILY 1.2-like [Amaranthus tricolor]
MEDNLEEEKSTLLSNHQNSEDETPSSRKGGLITMPFIIVNESFEKVASYGLLPNMIFYLMNVYHLEAARGTIILSLWSSASNILAIFGGFLSDSYLGRFKVIAFGTFCSLLGTSLLWSTSVIPWMKPSPCVSSSQSCDSATPLQFLVLFGSFGLISIGAGCVRPCSIAFGADQVNNKENLNNERVLDSFFNWYYASTGLSTIVALTVIVYIQDQFGWPIGFGIPACLMILSLVAFLFGSPLYVHVKAKENLFLGLFQVPIAAYRKRKISLPPYNSSEHYFLGNASEVTTLTDNIRCLNRACVIVDPETELNRDGTASNPWRLCTVERIETLKSILRIMPMWTTGIMMLVALNNSYTTLQAKTMDRHFISSFEIPAGTFHVFSIVTITFWVAFYDRALVPLLAKFFDMPRGLGPRVRMGLGLLLSCLAMLVAGFVESIRRQTAINEGLEDQPKAVLEMSAMWLVPQLVLLGLAEAFNAVGQIEFYYGHLSKTMSSLAMAIFTLGMAVSSLVGSLLVDIVDTFTGAGGKVSWLSSNLNKGHVDYYYWLVAFLCLVNFLYFLICCRVYGPDESHSQSLRSRRHGAKKESV